MGSHKEFNARTADQAGMTGPVVISYTKTNHLFQPQNTTQPPFFGKSAGVEKDQVTPNKN